MRLALNSQKYTYICLPRAVIRDVQGYFRPCFTSCSRVLFSPGWPQMCVCVCVCMLQHRRHLSQKRTTLGLDHRDIIHVPSHRLTHRPGAHLAFIRLMAGQWATVSSSHCPSSSGIADIHHAKVFIWVLGINCRRSSLRGEHFSESPLFCGFVLFLTLNVWFFLLLSCKCWDYKWEPVLTV